MSRGWDQSLLAYQDDPSPESNSMQGGNNTTSEGPERQMDLRSPRGKTLYHPKHLVRCPPNLWQALGRCTTVRIEIIPVDAVGWIRHLLNSLAATCILIDYIKREAQEG